MRTFETGATRDDATEKPDYDGFLSPQVIIRFGQYMHKHRRQADGNLRDSDNWQKGIPTSEYMKSMYRHFVDFWTLHRKSLSGCMLVDEMEELLCAILFNVQGYLHSLINNTEAVYSGELHTVEIKEDEALNKAKITLGLLEKAYPTDKTPDQIF